MLPSARSVACVHVHTLLYPPFLARVPARENLKRHVGDLRDVTTAVVSRRFAYTCAKKIAPSLHGVTRAYDEVPHTSRDFFRSHLRSQVCFIFAGAIGEQRFATFRQAFLCKRFLSL